MARKCFYSFHYKPDCQRAAQIRQIGAIEGNQPAKDNDWEEVTKGGDKAIEDWISEQLKGRTCTIVLVGKDTARRKWIDHEIVESWRAGMGVAAIYIHGIKNLDGEITTKGNNPFDHFTVGKDKKELSSIVKCYDPPGATSKEKYAWIAENIDKIVEEAITIRNKY